MVFPVIHSTLDPKALTQEIKERYALQGKVRCQLMSRANNDFYEVTAAGARFALRVAKANFRTPDEYLFEAQYVSHLKAEGCLVPAPVPAQDGSYFFEVEAPDGARAITLMNWLDGKPFNEKLSNNDAAKMGAALASLHNAGESFKSQSTRSISTVDILNERMPDLYALLEADPEHQKFYRDATEKVVAEYAKLDPKNLRCGPVHGDFQFANVMRTGDGAIAVLDFDTCGTGLYAEDLYTFIWRSDMEIRSEFVNQAFVEGYQGARPLNAEELNGGPLFRVARDLVMSSTYAILINRVGPVPGFDGDFQPFTQLARQHLQYAELD